MIIISTNCIVHWRPWMEWQYAHFLTAGFLKLFGGKSISLSDEVYSEIIAIKDPNLPYFPQVFHAISVNSVDAIVWSPYADLVLPPSALLDTDGDEFAHLQKQTWGKLLHDNHRDIETELLPAWDRLCEATKNIKRRVIVTYPTHLMPLDNEKNAKRKARFCKGQSIALELMLSHGWHHMTLREDVPAMSNGKWWAHFDEHEVDLFTDDIGAYVHD